jgi:hypothetical protein
MHVLGNILQDSSIEGSNQLTKPIQFLTAFTMQHVKDTLDTQYGEVVI